jgi:hypothetical protein
MEDSQLMEFPDIEILNACYEAEQRQREMIPLLASAVGVSAEAVFYTWAFRKCRQRGTLPGTPWQYFFHGLECDLKNSVDGRFLRLDFGPGGRIDTFSAWGVLQLLMTSTSPWPDFMPLKELFADKEPPYDENSGNLSRLFEYWERLNGEGCFDAADPALVEFQARCTVVDSTGMQFVRFPPGTPEETQIDCSVAHRTHLSAHGRQLLETRPTSRCT